MQRVNNHDDVPDDVPDDVAFAEEAVEQALLEATVRERLAQGEAARPLDAAFVTSLGLDPADFDL